MRPFVLMSVVLLAPAMGFSQPTSVMIEDLTTTEVADAIAAAKTTAIYYVGGAHENGDAVAIGKHNILVNHLARRIAEELGNALVYPINPYAPAGDPVAVRTLVKIKVPSSSSSLVYCSRAAKRGPGSHRGREIRRRLADAGRAESPGVGGDRVEGHRLWG